MTDQHRFHPSILREYDIRGTYGETLFDADAHALGRRFGALLRQAGGSAVVVGRDGRLSSPALEAALVEGLIESGVEVVRIGLSSTPMLYFAEASTEEVQGGIQVTGSHNPADHNGFKMVLRGAPFFGDAIRELGAEIGAAAIAALPPALPGRVEERDVLPDYVDRLLKGLAGIDPDDLRGLRMAWDAGNGAAGPALEMLTARLPGEHHLLFSEVDGRFPNHHPDPTVDANLADLRAIVAAKKLDFGVAFDGDADRIGAIDAQGRTIDADQLLIIFARDVLARHPGAAVIADVKASRAVHAAVRQAGGQPIMAPSGHSHVKARMKETGALLGGETSGHMFFADDYFGFDDGLYAAVRLIAATARTGRSLAQLRDSIPPMCNTPELRFAVPEDRKFAIVAQIRAALAGTGAQVNDMDGVRVDTPDGWWLLRASNTQAALTARAESGSAEGLERLVEEIDRHLAAQGIARDPAR